MEDQGKVLCFFKENREDFNTKLAYVFEEYLKESNEKVENCENID